MDELGKWFAAGSVLTRYSNQDLDTDMGAAGRHGMVWHGWQDGDGGAPENAVADSQSWAPPQESKVWYPSPG